MPRAEPRHGIMPAASARKRKKVRGVSLSWPSCVVCGQAPAVSLVSPRGGPCEVRVVGRHALLTLAVREEAVLSRVECRVSMRSRLYTALHGTPAQVWSKKRAEKIKTKKKRERKIYVAGIQKRNSIFLLSYHVSYASS